MNLKLSGEVKAEDENSRVSGIKFMMGYRRPEGGNRSPDF